MLARLKRNWSYLAIAVVIVFFIMIPYGWLPRLSTTLMIVIGIDTIVTVGLCLLMGYTGQVSLGQAAFFGMGAYVSAILSKTYGVNPWLAMLIAAIMTGAFAYIIGSLIFRLKGNYLAMATLGVGLIMGILFAQLRQFTGGTDGIWSIPPLSIGSFVFDTPFRQYFLVWFFCLAVLLISQNIVRSRTGRALRAVHGSEAAAESIGINVNRFKVKILVLSAVYASIAGSLLVNHMSGVNPQLFDFMASVKLVVMAVIGGLASVWGAIFGAGATHILSDEVLLRFGDWDVAIYGLILVLVIIFMPDGLFVKLKEVFERLRLRYKQRGVES